MAWIRETGGVRGVALGFAYLVGHNTRRQASSCTYGAGVLDEPPDPVVPLMSTVADPPPDVVVPLIETVSDPPPPPVVPLLVPPPPPVVPLLVPPPPPVVPLILTVPPPLPVVPLRSCWCVWLAPFDVWSSNWSALMAAEPDPDPERVEAPVRSYPWVWLAVVPPVLVEKPWLWAIESVSLKLWVWLMLSEKLWVWLMLSEKLWVWANEIVSLSLKPWVWENEIVSLSLKL